MNNLLVFLVFSLLFLMPTYADSFTNWLNNIIDYNTQLSFNSFSNSTHIVFSSSNSTNMFFNYANGPNPLVFTYSNSTSLGITFSNTSTNYQIGQMIMLTGTERPITGKLAVSVFYDNSLKLHFDPVYEDINGNFVVLIDTRTMSAGNYTVLAQSDNANQTSTFSIVNGIKP